ncbi:hypothetical protein [Bosea sp. (in: a-proteobacteria)]|jgi:hypothetical protein|uniref:hypothetical protein n=1 Tax=Bosea sp. (in: a-proteobacteria) TaxID=1871050 RepID=UPI003F6FB3E1
MQWPDWVTSGRPVTCRYSTLGLRASTNVGLQGMDLIPCGGLVWRHASAMSTPRATLAFAGSNPFSVAGLRSPGTPPSTSGLEHRAHHRLKATPNAADPQAKVF